MKNFPKEKSRKMCLGFDVYGLDENISEDRQGIEMSTKFRKIHFNKPRFSKVRI